jgi:hypothetical protein
VVVVEESASPPQGEPRAVPYRHSSVPDEPSQRVQGDDPVAVLRAELAERDTMIGRLLASMANVEQQLATVQNSMAPPPDVPATPAAWKGWLFKALVSIGAILTATATILGWIASKLPPKVEANEVRTTVTESKTDTAATDIAALRGRVSLLERRDDDEVAYWLEIWRMTGVQIRRPEQLQAAPKIEVVVPHRRDGDGPSLIVNTPPPK